MKKTAMIIMTLVFAVALLLFLFVQRDGQRARLPRIGDQAPEFRLPSLDGTLVGLADLRGKVVLVHFWATWCPPCVEELPGLERFYRSLLGADIELLAVSVDDTGAGAVREFLERNGLTVKVLLDPGQEVAQRYGTFKFPETYLVDREGIIRRKLIGAMDWDRPEAREMVNDLLKKQ